MFDHSVKVPRHYKIAANIFKKVSTEGGSVKTLLYDDKLRHFRTNVLFALITETIKHAADISKIFEHCSLFDKEPRFDPWLAKVLTAELLFGKKILPGKSKPEQTILSYKEQFEKYASEHQDDMRTEDTPKPRYVRINTNLLTTSDAIRAFQDEGYRFIRCTSGSYGDYLEQIQKLTEDEFTQDYHVKTIFVFAPGTKWHNHELYLENQIILQDKATALAVHLLAPPQGSVVLDMCAAPGMKTTQLAAYLRNDGMIYAVERNQERYQTLCNFVEKTGSSCVHTYHRDSLDIKKGEFENVEYILLDPSCSGSGMGMLVHKYEPDQERLEKLTSLQEKFLKHAMNSFPKAKRIVYSTCSVYPEENERVIANVVRTSRSKWRVQNVKDLLKDQWNNFGSGMYGSTGTRCLYAKPALDLTTGFFLAVLDRDEKDLAKVYKQEEKKTRDEKKAAAKSNKDRSKNDNSGDRSELDAEKHESKKEISEEANEMDADQIFEKKKKKKDKQKRVHEEAGIENNPNLEEIDIDEAPKKKKKKNKHSEDINTPSEGRNVEDSVTGCKKRKLKNNDAVFDQNSQSSVNNIINNLEYLNVEDLDITISKKKKKKYKSHNEDEIVDIENCNIQPTENSKKKKKKAKVEESNSQLTEETSYDQEASNLDFSDNNLKKNKKKNKKSQDINN